MRDDARIVDAGMMHMDAGMQGGRDDARGCGNEGCRATSRGLACGHSGEAHSFQSWKALSESRGLAAQLGGYS